MKKKWDTVVRSLEEGKLVEALVFNLVGNSFLIDTLKYSTYTLYKDTCEQ